MAAGSYCEATDVNDAGQVTGRASIHPDPDRLPHAFVHDGTFRDLGILPDGATSEGLAINDHGDVAGRASVPPNGSQHFHATFWPAGGQIMDLDPHGKYVSSIATAVNNHGQVVGTVTLDAHGHMRAVRFDGQRAIRLETEVRNLQGWTLEQSFGVNDHGEIVGRGEAPDGSVHGFLLRPE